MQLSSLTNAIKSRIKTFGYLFSIVFVAKNFSSAFVDTNNQQTRWYEISTTAQDYQAMIWWHGELLHATLRNTARKYWHLPVTRSKKTTRKHREPELTWNNSIMMAELTKNQTNVLWDTGNRGSLTNVWI